MVALYDVNTAELSLITADSLGETLAASSQGHCPRPHISCENPSRHLPVLLGQHFKDPGQLSHASHGPESRELRHSPSSQTQHN